MTNKTKDSIKKCVTTGISSAVGAIAGAELGLGLTSENPDFEEYQEEQRPESQVVAERFIESYSATQFMQERDDIEVISCVEHVMLNNSAINDETGVDAGNVVPDYEITDAVVNAIEDSVQVAIDVTDNDVVSVGIVDVDADPEVEAEFPDYVNDANIDSFIM